MFGKAIYSALFQLINNSYTRKELRDLAWKHGVERGQNKQDTIANLANSDKFSLKIKLIRR